MILPSNTRIKGGKVQRALLWGRLLPADGDLILSGDGLATPGVQESSVFVTPAGIELWYTESIIGTPAITVTKRAVAPDMDSAFVPDAAYIGNNNGGNNGSSNGSQVWYDSGTYYSVATKGYAVIAPERDGKVYFYSTNNLASGFTNHGVLLDQSLVSGCTVYGNCSIVLNENNVPAVVGGKYKAVVELGGPDSHWASYHFESNSLGSGWAMVNKMPTLQPVASAMYGGVYTKYINGVYHHFYHYGSQVGDLPTLVAYATSTDLVTATIREAPFSLFNPQPWPSTDQIADPYPVEIAGKTYMFYELLDNTYVGGSLIKSQIRKKTFDGTFLQLVNGIYRNATQSPL